jgi:hypothetical protein
MRYLLLHYLDESTMAAPDDTSGDAEDAGGTAEDELSAWVAGVEASGTKLYGGELRPAADTKLIRVRKGELMATDGPFAETKEQIAGIDVLKCDSLQDAIELAARHPTARAGTFELRPFRD